MNCCKKLTSVVTTAVLSGIFFCLEGGDKESMPPIMNEKVRSCKATWCSLNMQLKSVLGSLGQTQKNIGKAHTSVEFQCVLCFEPFLQVSL